MLRRESSRPSTRRALTKGRVDRSGRASALRRLDDYLDHELRADDMSTIREHLATCAACTRRFRLEARLLIALRLQLRDVRGAEALRARVMRIFGAAGGDVADPDARP